MRYKVGDRIVLKTNPKFFRGMHYNNTVAQIYEIGGYGNTTDIYIKFKYYDGSFGTLLIETAHEDIIRIIGTIEKPKYLND